MLAPPPWFSPQEMKEATQVSSWDIKQIDLDMNKTFRNHIMFWDHLWGQVRLLGKQGSRGPRGGPGAFWVGNPLRPGGTTAAKQNKTLPHGKVFRMTHVPPTSQGLGDGEATRTRPPGVTV